MNDSQDDVELSENAEVDENICLSMIIILYKHRPLSRIQALLFDFRSESFLYTRSHGSSMSMIVPLWPYCNSYSYQLKLTMVKVPWRTVKIALAVCGSK